MRATALCFDVETAYLLLQRGVAVVLVGEDAEALGRAAPGLRAQGRVAIFVGDRADATVMDAARAMAAEQFGAEPVVVPDLEFARRLDPLVK
jgi:3-hydroxyisobutyrate dehydrogenase-like beta-hydroxyacid dehydrogenase